jgi:hypothetical protein
MAKTTVKTTKSGKGKSLTTPKSTYVRKTRAGADLAKNVK